MCVYLVEYPLHKTKSSEFNQFFLQNTPNLMNVPTIRVPNYHMRTLYLVSDLIYLIDHVTTLWSLVCIVCGLRLWRIPSTHPVVTFGALELFCLRCGLWGRSRMET